MKTKLDPGEELEKKPDLCLHLSGAAGEEKVEKGVAETSCYRLTAIPVSHLPAMLKGRR